MSKEFEMEQSLLGGLMRAGNTETDIINHVLRILKPNSFANRVHSEIYKAIRVLSSIEGAGTSSIFVWPLTFNNCFISISFMI